MLFRALIVSWATCADIELIALCVHPKKSNHLRSHTRAIMALDHSRLGLENKSGQILCVRQVYFTKSCQQIGGCVNQPFTLFIHHIWGETVLFIIQTLQNAIFHNFSRQIALSRYSGQSIVGFQRNHLKSLQNHLYGHPVLPFDRHQICSASCGRVRLAYKSSWNLFTSAKPEW